MKNGRMHRKVVVRTRRPWLTQSIVLLLFATAIGGGWWVFESGKTYGRTEYVKLRKEVRQKRRIVKDLGERNALCRQNLANLEQSKEIDQLAYAEVERNLVGFHTEMAEIKEEVAFYRSIITPISNQRGLKIQNFTLEKIAQERTYRYRIVLIQVMPSRLIQGKVELDLTGKSSAGTQQNLSLRHLSKKKALNFKFKYFQNLEGKFTFPLGFTPDNVTVKVRAKGKKAKKLSKTFGWQQLVS